MNVFLDTSAFYALLDGDDANHNRARTAWGGLIGAEDSLITTNYIIVETFALAQNRLGLEAARAFQEDIVPLINIEWVTPEIHRAGVAAFLSASKRGPSLADCVSFEIMRASGIKTAFAFDRHFGGQGFALIPHPAR
jgi:predicted nucleic acid-binding protein